MSRPMKDSGVEWLGDIPADWSVVNIRKLFSFGKGLSITKEDLRESGQPVVSYGQIHSKLNSGTALTPELIRFVDDDYLQSNPQSLVKRGDFIFADTSEDLAGCGNCVYVDADAPIFAGYHTIILRNKTCADLKYCAFLFQSDAWRKQIREQVTGVKLFSISQKILRATSVLLPPLDEQQRIATFLDDKCARIDSVIEKTRASIEEYKKLKQAVITRAVTKGIRPNRTFKHSGVEWIGDIPDGWEVVKLKYIADFQPNCDTSNLTEESEITYTPMEFIKNGYFINNTATYGSVAKSLTPYNEGDIVMAKVTPCFENGNIAVMENLSSGFGLGSSELFVFRAHSIAIQYLFYWLQNNLFMQQGCATMTGTGGLKRVSPYFIRNSQIPIPPLDEQKEIAQYLDEKTSAIDSLVAKKNQLVTELESLKKSMIFEYVTGKKEVGK